MTFSYHVRAKDNIKCYLLWNGQIHRFYPQDILEVLPEIFKMDTKEREDFVTSDQIKRIIRNMKPFHDDKFEHFYCALRQKKNFPKKI